MGNATGTVVSSGKSVCTLLSVLAWALSAVMVCDLAWPPQLHPPRKKPLSIASTLLTKASKGLFQRKCCFPIYRR